MANNNLLMIICIGIVVFWIFNIKTSSITKKSSNIENYRNDVNDANDKNKVSSPLLSNNSLSDDELIQKLYNQNINNSKTSQSSRSSQPLSVRTTSSKSVSGSVSYSRALNKDQKLIKTPPNDRKPNEADKMARDIAKQLIPDSKQKMYSKENPLGLSSTADSKFQDYNTDNYMLLPKNAMPDKKFDKVLPSEVRKTLTSNDLLPVDENKDWFQVPNSTFNLMQAVDLEIPEIKIGIDTVGQSRKNANYDLRVAPACPKFVVSPWFNSTIEPDYNTKSLC